MLQKLKDATPVNEKKRYTLFSTIINELIKSKLSENDADFISKVLIEASYTLYNNKKELLKIRQEIWETNFGVPSLEFLLVNRKQIDTLVEKINNDYSPDELINSIVLENKSIPYGEKNTNFDLYESYEKPTPDISGLFIATANKQGFMTTKAVDPFSLQFIDKAVESSKLGGRVLEIGAAYGVATLVALERGATVVCNDLAPEHLAVVVKEHIKMQRGRLVPVAGAFPDELVFKDNEFDAILISRVLHFFDGDKIVSALNKARQWLKQGGSLYVINETPFLSNWSSFLQEYNERKQRGEKWPGLIVNTSQYEQNRSLSLPPLVHWLDQDTLKQALLEAGFNESEVQISYINREGQFPPDMLLKEEQRESVGCKATKLGK